jgi:hypothetical protein
VLRSKSNLPYVAEHRELIHKIGVTGGSVEARIAHAPMMRRTCWPTWKLLPPTSWRPKPRTKLEEIIHRVFAMLRLI